MVALSSSDAGARTRARGSARAIFRVRLPALLITRVRLQPEMHANVAAASPLPQGPGIDATLVGSSLGDATWEGKSKKRLRADELKLYKQRVASLFELIDIVLEGYFVPRDKALSIARTRASVLV